MSYIESVLKRLLDLIPQTRRFVWIGIRPGKKQDLTELKSVRHEQGSGLVGNRFCGINLLSFKHQTFQIGETVLQTTGIFAPYIRMDEILGPGGYNPMRGHGGITAKVLEASEIHIDDPVQLWKA